MICKSRRRISAHFALSAIICIVILYSSPSQSRENPYETFDTFVTIPTKTLEQNNCVVKVVADFDLSLEHYSVYRDEWLNRDYSLDFYQQRRKQVFLFVVAKRVAEVITESVYVNSDINKIDKCLFGLDIKYNDNFGGSRVVSAITWTFTRQQANKVKWDTFDPREFHEVALNYRIADEMDYWTAGEPKLANSTPSTAQAPTSNCDEQFLRANAVFIRASTYCSKDYMDTPAGMYALEKSRQCSNLPEAQMLSTVKAAMMELDQIVARKRVGSACRYIGELELQVLRSIGH